MAVVLVWLACSSWLVAADQPSESSGLPDEYAVKAVFLYSFGRHVTWPDSAFGDASAPFVVGILGEDPFGGALDAIAAKKTLHQRQIVVRRFASPEQFRQPCHILFVSRSLSDEQRAALVAKVQGQPMLIVGETPGFAQRGAIANFYSEEESVRFELNLSAARQAQLRMDAKLLNLGKPVGPQRSSDVQDRSVPMGNRGRGGDTAS